MRYLRQGTASYKLYKFLEEHPQTSIGEIRGQTLIHAPTKYLAALRKRGFIDFFQVGQDIIHVNFYKNTDGYLLNNVGIANNGELIECYDNVIDMEKHKLEVEDIVTECHDKIMTIDDDEIKLAYMHAYIKFFDRLVRWKSR